MSNPFTLYIIHHNHTDIGYTDPQEKIELHHIYFIKEVIDILNAAHSHNPEWLGFKWNCESFWSVEKFLDWADDKYKNDFIKYIKSGEIGLSGSYLNTTELVSTFTLNSTISHCCKIMSEFSIALRSAMTADINGYSWGFSDALYDHGITRLLSCIHTHHGFYPLHKRQTPFYWKSPKGNRIFVWSADHYNLGNELCISLQPANEYIIKDGLNTVEPNLFRRGELRIQSYVDSLVKSGYKYNFIPVTVSGRATDNSCPNAEIVEFCKRYNVLHGNQIHLEIVTLDEFFDIAEAYLSDVPVYSGDWTDWWADGIGSSPDVVQHYRDASRKLDLVNQIDKNGEICEKELLDKVRYNLMMYGEHTWGYLGSVIEPWTDEVHIQEKRKSLFAFKANEYASRAVDKITYSLGETPPSTHKSCSIIAYNPHNRIVTDTIVLNAETIFEYELFKVIDSETGCEIPYQIGHYTRRPVFVMQVTLNPNSKKEYILQEVKKSKVSDNILDAPFLADGTNDLEFSLKNQLDRFGNAASQTEIETDFFSITFDKDYGITSIFDKKKKSELIKTNSRYAPFTPIYEITKSPVPENQFLVRQTMGRNRKSTLTNRHIGKVCDIKVIEQGAVYSCVEISYKLEGTELCSLVLTAYSGSPRLDIALRLHKNSVWSPENLYLALPFTSGENEEFWIEKTGAILRPRIDQIPGSCIDFYLLQSGMCFCGKNGSVVIATPDTPLIAMGSLNAHKIKLHGDSGIKNNDDVYSWVMNNFWETNFKADLGGFYQFRYSLISSDDESPEAALCTAREACNSVLGFYSFLKDK